MIEKVKERRQDKTELVKALINIGGKPASGNSFHCPYHNDKTASAWVKRSAEGFYYFKCFTCNLWKDVWDIDCQVQGKDFKELVTELYGAEPAKEYKTIYKSIDELVESLEAIEIEEINKYTNPDTGNIDLLVIRYLKRGEKKKSFLQGYQSPQGFVRKKPAGLTPLFNRKGILATDTVFLVEGEKVVRFLTKMGYTATTGAGGAGNYSNTDYSPLAGKSVYLWRDYDEPGREWLDGVKAKLLELDPQPYILSIKVDELELPLGGDAIDWYEKIMAEGGDDDDFSASVDSLMEDAVETNPLSELDELINDMQSGAYRNLPIKDFPMLSREAALLLNKRVSVIYGTGGFGKSLFAGKMCDDLALEGHKVARLQLEDELGLHLLRTFAQQMQRSELVNPDWHRENAQDSTLLYESMRPTLTELAKTVISGESEDWDSDKILQWMERKLEAGAELIVIDPVSVIMADKIWIACHKLVWHSKRLVAKYPNARVVFISHNNTEGEVAGGQAFKRFCHNVLFVNAYKKPKDVTIVDKHGEVRGIELKKSITIVKTRYGTGNGLEIAVELDPSTICFNELGIVLEEEKSGGGGRRVGSTEEVEL